MLDLELGAAERRQGAARVASNAGEALARGSFPFGEAALGGGDTLVLYTDGITEAWLKGIL